MGDSVSEARCGVGDGGGTHQGGGGNGDGLGDEVLGLGDVAVGRPDSVHAVATVGVAKTGWVGGVVLDGHSVLNGGNADNVGPGILLDDVWLRDDVMSLVRTSIDSGDNCRCHCLGVVLGAVGGGTSVQEPAGGGAGNEGSENDQ